MDASRIYDFLKGPLVTWFASCLEYQDNITYADIVDGVLIHHVFLQMNLNVQETDIHFSDNDPILRLRNLKKILNNLLQCYSDYSDELTLPNIDRLARDPELYVSEAEQLLKLLLGCAVECPNKQFFINKIMALDEQIQAAIAECIIKVIRNPDIQEAFENANLSYQEPRQKAHNILCENTFNESKISYNTEILDSSRKSDNNEFRRQEIELFEYKAKVKKQTEDLKETMDDLKECRKELQFCKEQVIILQRENERLVLEAKNAKSYRDELDAISEKTERVDHLEQKVESYKEKLTCFDLYKTRMNKLQEDNRLLKEKNYELVEQLRSFKSKYETTKIDLEKQIFNFKKRIEELQTDNRHNNEKYLRLCEENEKLEQLLKSTANVSMENDSISDFDDSTASLIDKSLSEQLINSTQSQALKLELENRRLSILVDSYKERSLLENSNKLLDLEEDRRKLLLKIDSLNNDVQELTQEKKQLESVVEKSMEENQKLQQQLKKDFNFKYEDLENMYVDIVKEKKCLRLLLERAHKRLHDFELYLNDKNTELEETKMLKDTMNETKLKLLILESEKKIFQKRVQNENELIKEASLAYDITSKIVKQLEIKLKKFEKNNQISIQGIQKLESCMEMFDKDCWKNTVKLRKIHKNPDEEKVLDASTNTSKGEVEPQFIEVQNLTETALLFIDDQRTPEKHILQRPCNTFNTNQKHFKTSYYYLHTINRVMPDKNILSNHVRDVNLELQPHCKSIENLKSVKIISKEEYKDLEFNHSMDNVDDNVQLKEDFYKLFKIHTLLIGVHEKLKNELEKFERVREILQNELKAKNNQIIKLESKISEFSHRHEIIIKHNENLDKDKQSLMNHIHHLTKQIRHLSIRNLQDRENYHIEQRKDNERIMNLNRHKEKLEEKIMDQYKNMTNSSMKKKPSKNVIKRTFYKIRRAGSEILNRSRSSWLEESRSTVAEQSCDLEYMQGDDSKISLGDNDNFTKSVLNQPRQVQFSDFACSSRKSADFLNDFHPSDFSFSNSQGHPKARSRKSTDVLSNFSSINNECIDKHDKSDDNILHKISRTEDFTNNEQATDFTNKSIDSSFHYSFV